MVNKFILVGDQFMPEIHLKQPGLLKVLVDHLLKIKKEFKNLKKIEDSRYTYRNGLHKTWFQHDMAYEDFKDLARKTVSDKFLRDKTFNIAKNPKYDGYRRCLTSMVYKMFD